MKIALVTARFGLAWALLFGTDLLLALQVSVEEFIGGTSVAAVAAGLLESIVAAASLSPNSVVVAVDAAHRRLLVRQLVPTARPPGRR